MPWTPCQFPSYPTRQRGAQRPTRCSLDARNSHMTTAEWETSRQVDRGDIPLFCLPFDLLGQEEMDSRQNNSLSPCLLCLLSTLFMFNPGAVCAANLGERCGPTRVPALFFYISLLVYTGSISSL